MGVSISRLLDEVEVSCISSALDEDDYDAMLARKLCRDSV